VPTVVRQERHRRCGGSVFAFRDDPSCAGTEPHDVEIVSGDDPGTHDSRLVGSEQGERHGGELRDAFETRALPAVVVDLGDGKESVVDPGKARGVTQVDEAIAVAVWKRTEPDLDHRKIAVPLRYRVPTSDESDEVGGSRAHG
jgi:hypothetical protein